MSNESYREVPVAELSAQLERIRAKLTEVIQTRWDRAVELNVKKARRAIFRFWRRRWSRERIIEWMKEPGSYDTVVSWEQYCSSFYWTESDCFDRLSVLVKNYDQTGTVNVSSRDASILNRMENKDFY